MDIDKLKNQIKAVRDCGKTNMFDINNVMFIAYKAELFELVDYLMDKHNRKKYCKFIMTGNIEELR